ncbi:hypothetical protein ACZ91_48340 [Streptomyces regensis]|nr:hypothetical protein ACZ91_48340 [Streptomyces regensis]
MPTRNTGFSIGLMPVLPTVKTRVRPGGAPNQVSSPPPPVSRVSDSTASRPAERSAGSGATGWPATSRTASASAPAPVTVATCTTQGQGTGGSATGSFRLKAPSAPVVTARPSPFAQELVPPTTPRAGVARPHTSTMSRVRGRQPVPLTVTAPPAPA